MFVQGSHENASFFAESAGQQAKYSLLYAYRVGGPPTYIEDLCISGPSNYQASFHNLVGIRMENTNGFYFKGIWFTAYEAGYVLTAESVIQSTCDEPCRSADFQTFASPCTGSGS